MDVKVSFGERMDSSPQRTQHGMGRPRREIRRPLRRIRVVEGLEKKRPRRKCAKSPQRTRKRRLDIPPGDLHTPRSRDLQILGGPEGNLVQLCSRPGAYRRPLRICTLELHCTGMLNSSAWRDFLPACSHQIGRGFAKNDPQILQPVSFTSNESEQEQRIWHYRRFAIALHAGRRSPWDHDLDKKTRAQRNTIWSAFTMSPLVRGQHWLVKNFQKVWGTESRIHPWAHIWLRSLCREHYHLAPKSTLGKNV